MVRPRDGQDNRPVTCGCHRRAWTAGPPSQRARVGQRHHLARARCTQGQRAGVQGRARRVDVVDQDAAGRRSGPARPEDLDAAGGPAPRPARPLPGGGANPRASPGRTPSGPGRAAIRRRTNTSGRARPGCPPRPARPRAADGMPSGGGPKDAGPAWRPDSRLRRCRGRAPARGARQRDGAPPPAAARRGALPRRPPAA